MINHIILNSAHIASSPGKSGTWWKYCNIGIGAFLHEVGHCLSAALSPKGAHWYRSDVVRFRYHLCFRLPFELSAKIDLKNVGADFWILNKFLLIKCSAGISLIEIYVGNNIIGYLDYSDDEYNQTEIRLKIEKIWWYIQYY
ncbi:hypothetical protein RhiirA1_460322 [Rhizophagus irregularis]|uniref:Uncharacterized protein n=1 Tax=Rhizophagus irregularis TaxID=588596 RepID=A0A2N0RRQ8_9GLOM|nr:hypothetical protein RhiirA1_460322 [Rhizophagus irregularis]